METIKRQFEEVQREKEKSIEELRPLTEKLDALKAQSREYRDTLEAGKAPMLEAIKRRLTAQTHNTHWKTEIAEQKKKIAKLQEQSTEVQEKLDEFTTSAEAFEAERPDDISHQPEWYSRVSFLWNAQRRMCANCSARSKSSLSRSSSQKLSVCEFLRRSLHPASADETSQ
jgi:chromosome segregation ATPase